MGKMHFLFGAAVGYVLGARAGRQRYEQIKQVAGQIWRSAPVQGQLAAVKHNARTKAAPAALDAVSMVAAGVGNRMRAQSPRSAHDARVHPDTHQDLPDDRWGDEGGADALGPEAVH